VRENNSQTEVVFIFPRTMASKSAESGPSGASDHAKEFNHPVGDPLMFSCGYFFSLVVLTRQLCRHSLEKSRDAPWSGHHAKKRRRRPLPHCDAIRRKRASPQRQLDEVPVFRAIFCADATATRWTPLQPVYGASTASVGALHGDRCRPKRRFHCALRSGTGLAWRIR
jgi:hypothetical protein